MSTLISPPGSMNLPRTLLMAGLLLPFYVMASPQGDALRQMTQNTWVTRTTTLADLGLETPVVLNRNDVQQEFYLPVPKGVPLTAAAISFDAKYLKAEDGPTRMVLAVDGEPVTAQALSNGDGLVKKTLAVDAKAHGSGFVRLGVTWQSNPADLRLCEVVRSTANSLTISPTTGLTYRYDSSTIINLDDAWHTLPGSPVLLLSGQSVDKGTFDSAWRIGVALERSGKKVQVRAFPSVGDSVDLRGVEVPVALRFLPAFATLSNASATHKLANPAEIGALLILGAPATRADIVLANASLRNKMNEALDALQQQFNAHPDADALAAFLAWRQRRAPLSIAELKSHEILLTSLSGRPVIAVASDAGAQAAGVFDTFWRRVLNTHRVTVQTATAPEVDHQQMVRLSNLGGTFESFDVLSSGDWIASFPLSAVSFDGQMPVELVLDLAAAPGASSTRPVASVFWNGILLSARQLDATGEPEQLKARVPGYALRIQNTVRVTFQRQPVSGNCNETPQAFPVSVLPSSYVKSGDTEMDDTFVALLPLMAGQPQIITPTHYLNTAPHSVQQVIRVASASGVSPTKAELQLVDANQTIKPSKPFLAMSVSVAGSTPKVTINNARQLQINGQRTALIDISGLEHLSTIEVSNSGNQHGLLWHTLGTQDAIMNVPFILNRGNLAIIGPNGPVAWMDRDNPESSSLLEPGKSAFYEWRRYLAWGVPIISFGLLALVLIMVLSMRAKRLANKKE